MSTNKSFKRSGQKFSLNLQEFLWRTNVRMESDRKLFQIIEQKQNKRFCQNRFSFLKFYRKTGKSSETSLRV